MNEIEQNQTIRIFFTWERCLRSCDRFSSPPLVIFEQLIIRANKTSHSCHYSLLAEVESDSVES